MTLDHQRRIINAATVALEAQLQQLGCPNPLVQIRLTDVDTAPAAGPYLDIAVSARIYLSDSPTP